MSTIEQRRAFGHERKATPMVLNSTPQVTTGWKNAPKSDPVEMRVRNLNGVQGSNIINEPLDSLYLEDSKPSQQHYEKGGIAELRQKIVEKMNVVCTQGASVDKVTPEKALRAELTELKEVHENLKEKFQILKSVIDIQNESEKALEMKVHKLELIIKDLVISKLELADETSQAMCVLRQRLTGREQCNCKSKIRKSVRAVSH